MTWLRFSADFDFVPPARRGVTVAFKAGMCRPAPRVCVALATQIGVAELIPSPDRAEARRLLQET